MRHKTEKKPTDIIPSRVVADVGRAIFGTHWQSQLAKGLRVQDQTMRRWTNDGCPSSYAKSMQQLLNNRATEIAGALKHLEEFDADSSQP